MKSQVSLIIISITVAVDTPEASTQQVSQSRLAAGLSPHPSGKR